jgi:transcriptional regulator with XRE-family HTH domain
MDARRLDLRMTWREVADAAGISPETIRAVRRGDNVPGDITRRGLEDALRWERGSIDRILAGGEPEPVREPAPGRGGPALPADDPRRRILDAALEQLTPEQQEAFLRQELEERQRGRRKAPRADDVRRRA